MMVVVMVLWRCYLDILHDEVCESSVMIESGPKKSSQWPRSIRLMSLDGENDGSAKSSSNRFENDDEFSDAGKELMEGEYPAPIRESVDRFIGGEFMAPSVCVQASTRRCCERRFRIDDASEGGSMYDDGIDSSEISAGFS